MTARGHRDLDARKRLVYSWCLAVGIPLILVVGWLRGADEAAVRSTHPMLAAVLSVLLVLLRTRRVTIATAERVVLTVVPLLWFARLGTALYGPGADLDVARAIVTESVGPGVAIVVIVAFLASDARVGLRISCALTGAFAAVGAPAVVPALLDGAQRTEALGIVRAWVHVAVVVALTSVLATLKEQVAAERARVEDLDLLASTDPVTGAANRRRGAEVLARRLREAERYGRPVAVALLDLDGFKSVNDLLGHEAGDRALRSVVGALQADLREVDTLARWGGDELLVIAPETTLTEIARSADRWRTRVAELGVRAGDVRLTASVGATVRRPGDTVDGLVRRADQAMYAAKERGGDQVVVARGDGAFATPAPSLDRDGQV